MKFPRHVFANHNFVVRIAQKLEQLVVAHSIHLHDGDQQLQGLGAHGGTQGQVPQWGAGVAIAH